jgi:PKD repeat protein
MSSLGSVNYHVKNIGYLGRRLKLQGVQKTSASKLESRYCLVSCFLMALFICIWPSSTKAATFCVGTAGQLQDALTTAANNEEDDIIRVAQGTYVGNFAYSSSAALTIKGGYSFDCASRTVDPTNTVLDGNGSGPVLTVHIWDDFTADGLTVKNGRGTGDEGGGLYVEGWPRGKVSINNCIISNNDSSAYGGGVCVVRAPPIVILTNNEIAGNFGYQGGGGVYVDGQEGIVTLTNNNIVDNYGYLEGGGVFITSSYSTLNVVTLTNNTISDNIIEFGWTAGVLIDPVRNANIYNNIIWRNVLFSATYDLRIYYTNEVNLFNNDFDHSRALIPGGGIDPSNLDNIAPLFVDAGSGDYRLLPESPCIDTGYNNAPELPGVDLEGHVRIVDGNNDGTETVDIGADEFCDSDIVRADFSASPVFGMRPLTVQFTNHSTACPMTSWSWNFGDGQSSTQPHPSHTFTDAGHFTVSLTVTGLGRSDTETKADYIHVIEPGGDPVIYKVRPRACLPGKNIRIIGTGFGEIQGSSYVVIGNKYGGKMFDADSSRIKLWTNTMIKIRTPKPKCAWFKGNAYRRRIVRVFWASTGDPSTGKYSNEKRFKLLKPDTCP